MSLATIEQSVLAEIKKVGAKIPLIEWATVAAEGRTLITNVVALVKAAKAGTITLEQAEAEADAAWGAFKQLVQLVHG